MPTDLPPEFKGTQPGKHKSVDPALVSPHRLAAEPKREPLLAGQPLGIKILRLVVLVPVMAAIVTAVISVTAVAVVAAVAAILWLLP